MQVEYDNFSRGGKKPRIACVDEQPVFTQLTTPARFNANHAKAREVIPEACRKLQDTLSGVLFLDPAPGQMRGYSLRTESKLRSNGANVSGVLHHLTETQGLKAEILEFVRALPESDIEDIGYLQTPRNEVMVTLKESFGGILRPREAVLLSDGTLRVLAIAAAMYAVPPGSIVVVVLLPMTTILETGNHIGQNGDARQRRAASGRFVRQVRAAIRGGQPFTTTPMPDPNEFECYLADFESWAERNDAKGKGSGLGDLTIYSEREKQRELNPARRVYIWSKDGHLASYDTGKR